MTETPAIIIHPGELTYIPLGQLRALRNTLTHIETGLKLQYRRQADETLAAACKNIQQNYDLIDAELLRRTEPSKKEI